MDTFTSPAKVQMTENLSPLKNHHDDDDDRMFEVDENQENNGLKRQRLNGECVQMTKNRNKLPSQPCACEHAAATLHTRCISTAAEKPINATNGTIQLKGTHITNSNDTIQSNGFYHNENGRAENVITTSSDDCSILTDLCDGQNQGYFDAMVSSESSDASGKLPMENDKCTNHILLNGNDHQHCDRAIAGGHRRTRARSSDSIQSSEFYQTRKQQMRIRSQNNSDVSIILYMSQK